MFMQKLLFSTVGINQGLKAIAAIFALLTTVFCAYTVLRVTPVWEMKLLLIKTLLPII